MGVTKVDSCANLLNAFHWQTAHGIIGRADSTASKAIREAQQRLLDPTASTKHFKEWARSLPTQVQALIDALAASPVVVPGRSGDTRFVPVASQYVTFESLITSVIYLGRLLTTTPDAERAGLLEPASMRLTFAACMVLADKFTNDDAYDDLLPAVGLVVGIQSMQLRTREVELLGTLMNQSSLFVAMPEFEALVYLLEEAPWAQLGKDGSLELLTRTVHEHLNVEEVHRTLFSGAAQPRPPLVLGTVRAFANYLRSVRARTPRTHSGADGEGGEEGGGEPPRERSSFIRRSAFAARRGLATSTSAGGDNANAKRGVSEGGAGASSNSRSSPVVRLYSSRADARAARWGVVPRKRGILTWGGASLGARSAPASPPAERRSFFGALLRKAKGRGPSATNDSDSRPPSNMASQPPSPPPPPSVGSPPGPSPVTPSRMPMMNQLGFGAMRLGNWSGGGGRTPTKQAQRHSHSGVRHTPKEK